MVAQMHPSGQSMTNLVNYNEKKVSRGIARRLGGHLTGESMSHIEGTGGKFDDHRRIYGALIRPELAYTGTSRRVTKHISLSFVPGEKPNDETLNKISKMYMDKVGFGNQPYQIYIHEDTNISHLHIISSRITSQGTLISDALDFKKSQRASRQIEKEFGLQEVSSIKTGQTFISGDVGVDSLKGIISSALAYALVEKKASSFQELRDLLTESGISATLNSENKHKNPPMEEGIAFYLTDGDEKQKTKAIPGGNVDPAYKYSALEAMLAANRIGKAVVIQEGMEQRAKAALEAFTLSGKVGPEAFKQALNAQGLRAVYKLLNDAPYDIILYDKETRENVKPAEISEKFRWEQLRQQLGYARHPDQDQLDQKAEANSRERKVITLPERNDEKAGSVNPAKAANLQLTGAQAMFEFTKEPEKDATVFAEILAKHGLEPRYKTIADRPYDVEIGRIGSEEKISLSKINAKLNWSNLSKNVGIQRTIQADLNRTNTQLNERPFFTEAALNGKLEAYGLKAVLARNSGGVYGISYANIATGEIHKASEIHDKLSWANVCSRFFDESNIVKSLTELTGRLAADLNKKNKQQASQTDMVIHLARIGITITKDRGNHFFEMKEPKVLIDTQKILQGKSLEQYFGVTRNSLSKEAAYAVKKGFAVVPSFTDREYKVYTAILSGKTGDIMKAAIGAVLPNMHLAEEMRYAAEIKLFKEARDLYKGLQRTEVFIDGTAKADHLQTGFIGPRLIQASDKFSAENPPVQGPITKMAFDKSKADTAGAIASLLPVVPGQQKLKDGAPQAVKGAKPLMDNSDPTFRELVIILNRRGIGVIYKDPEEEDSGGLRLTNKKNGDVYVTAKKISPVMTEAFNRAYMRPEKEGIDVMKELKVSEKGINPGFLEVLTQGQQQYYDACFSGNSLIISLERQKGNSVALTPQEMKIIGTLFPGAYEEGQTNDFKNIRSGYDAQEYEPSFADLLNRALAGEQPRNMGYHKPEEMGVSPKAKQVRKKHSR